MTTGVSIECPVRVSYRCHESTFHGLRSKAPARKKCACCGSTLSRLPVVWGVVEWRADGRYERPETVFPSPKRAEVYATGPNDVVRRFLA